jgi:excisionase family DNA binding protein
MGAVSVHPMDTLQLEKPANSAELEILTRRELAQRVKCSVRHLDALIAMGMPCIMLGRSRRFIFTEVLAWLKRRGVSR